MSVEQLGPGRFRLRNRRDFADLSDLRGEWELTDDGAAVRGGQLPSLRVPAGETLDVALDLGSPSAGERFITFRFFLRRADEWAAAGHEVAWQQLALPPRHVHRAAGRASRTLPTEAGGAIAFEAGGTRAVVDRETGVLADSLGQSAATFCVPALPCSSGARRPTTTVSACSPTASPPGV